MFLSPNPFSQLNLLQDLNLGVKRRRRGAWELESTFTEGLVEWNKFIFVRSEERAIYTCSRNLTVQIYVGTADVDLGTADLYRKHCSYKVKVTARRPTSGLPTYVGTADRRDCWRMSGLLTQAGSRDIRWARRQHSWQGSGLPTLVRSADASRQPRHPLGQASALLTRVGTPDRRDSRRTSGLLTSSVTAQAKWLGVRTPGASQHFRSSGLPTYVGTSDTKSH
jgi:hypothetical protein